MKKGQEAMEFLMTYGWAILVVIAAIAALAYFGVLDPSRLLPDDCEWEDNTPVDLVGARWWKNTETDEVVICPVVAPEHITEQCKEIAELCG
jgi:hypothetical protein